MFTICHLPEEGHMRLAVMIVLACLAGGCSTSQEALRTGSPHIYETVIAKPYQQVYREMLRTAQGTESHPTLPFTSFWASRRFMGQIFLDVQEASIYPVYHDAMGSTTGAVIDLKAIDDQHTSVRLGATTASVLARYRDLIEAVR
jgi:hypothetical protein